MKKIKYLCLSVLLLLSLGGCAQNNDGDKQSDEKTELAYKDRTDDWAYEPEQYEEDGYYNYKGGMVGSAPAPTMAAPMDFGIAESMPMMADDSIGFSVGGAKDINNFRENIKNDYLPLPTDLTYEGLFYDYYFDTGKKEECKKLFCPSYSYAISEDPISGADDYYLSVGLNSGIKESDFKRKKLNLVVVLDISGSMDSYFDEYYYDQPFDFDEGFNFESEPTKMEIAKQSVNALLEHLEADDRFGMVLFDDDAYLGKPLSLVGHTKMDKIKNHILEIEAMGGTYMEAGLKDGTALFDRYLDVDPEEYENRIIFLTDAMPNIGDTSKDGLLGMTAENAKNGIYTTFIGIGVDFNTELIEGITKVRGANYYSVHNKDEFKTRMDDEFEYMVTPLVFDLALKVNADGYDIEQVYGSPEADKATGEIMYVNTLFPSSTKGGETRGGLILLKLKKTSDTATIGIEASFKDRNGKADKDLKEVDFKLKKADYYENDGIRKGILLARYADLIKNWLIDEWRYVPDLRPVMPILISEKDGIIVPPIDYYDLNEWERISSDLSVLPAYKRIFTHFKEYFEDEMAKIGDDNLKKELEILEKILST